MKTIRLCVLDRLSSMGARMKATNVHYRIIRSRQGGFSLLEVLIALLVLSIGLLGLASLQIRSVQVNHSAYMRTQATNLAYAILDSWRANKDAVLSSGATPPDLNTWKGKIGEVLPGGDLQVALDSATQQYALTITWRDDRGKDQPNEQFTQFEVTSRL